MTGIDILLVLFSYWSLQYLICFFIVMSVSYDFHIKYNNLLFNSAIGGIGIFVAIYLIIKHKECKDE